jgi:hypothetical protein
MRTLYLMRGIPGGGKSTRAKSLAVEAIQDGASSVAICSTDNFFLDKDGVYRFDGKRIGCAHGWNQACARQMMENDINVVIIDNTNTTHKEMAPYKVFAKTHGYDVVEIIIGEDRLFPGMNGHPSELEDYIDMCARRNTHGVPRVNIERMARRFER